MIKLIKTEAEYEDALEKLYNFFQETPAEDSPEQDEFELLGILVHYYEEKHYPIPAPKFDTPIEGIKCHLDLRGIEESELATILGLSSQKTAEILNGHRKLTLPIIRKLHEKLKFSAEMLIQAY